jgi:hypothetical protein
MKKHHKMVLLLVVVLVFSIIAAGERPVKAQPSEPKDAYILPVEIKIGGVFPIVKRPDAGRDRRDAFLMAVYEINNQTGANRILPEGVKLIPIIKPEFQRYTFERP